MHDGKLYLTSELNHFELGWIKPGHKWITRTRSKDGKRWIYTYNKKTSNGSAQDDIDYAKLSGEQLAKMELCDEKIKDIEKILNSYNNPKVMSMDQIKAIKKKQKELADLKREREEYLNNANRYKRKARLQTYKKVNEIVAEKTKRPTIGEIFNNPSLYKKLVSFSKEDLEKQKKKVHAEVYKKKMSELDDKIAAGKKLLLESNKSDTTKTSKVSKAEIKERSTLINAINKLHNSKNAIYGLDIQKNYSSRSSQVESVNSVGYNKDNIDGKLYHQNCANCSVAYDMRSRGYDVKAKPRVDSENYSKHDGIDEIARDYYTGNKQMAKLITVDDDGVNRWNPDKQIKQAIKTASSDKNTPDSYNTWPVKSTARQLYGIQIGKTINNKTYVQQLEKSILKGGEGSRGIIDFYWAGYNSGHSVAYEVRNNKVIIVDAQSNKEYSISELYDCTWGMEYLRTDNLEPTKNIKNSVENSKR